MSYDGDIELKRINRFVEIYNNDIGDLQGYDCQECKNKGKIAFVKDGKEVHEFCKCMKIRSSLRALEKSGISKLVDCCTFANFQTNEKWQKSMIEKAIFFSNNPELMFFIGGQVGCGKTHICTALIGEFINQAKSCQYMMWRSVAPKMKALVNDREYFMMADELKKCDVLYIDDLFKTEKGKPPTAADINIAFEIITYRESNSLVTIISSEKTISELISIDESIGSRILKMSKQYCINILDDKSKNMRLKGNG